MRRTFNFLLLFFLSVMTVMAAPGDLQEKLAALKGISGIVKTSIRLLSGEICSTYYSAGRSERPRRRNIYATGYRRPCRL